MWRHAAHVEDISRIKLKPLTVFAIATFTFSGCGDDTTRETSDTGNDTDNDTDSDSDSDSDDATVTVTDPTADTTVDPTDAETTVDPTDAETTVDPTDAETTVDPTDAETTIDPTDAETTDAESSGSSTTDVVMCGNGIAEGVEACDGEDLAGESCGTQGFLGGTLACLDDCSGFDTDACTDEPSNCCTANDGPGCDDAMCVASICALDSFCCDDTWDQVCADSATGADGDGDECQACVSCGNGVIEGPEVCDGDNLGDADCASQGLQDGVLACAMDCGSFDITGCGEPIINDDCCSVPGPNVAGCSEAACEAVVCGDDAFCCDSEWDVVCVGAALLAVECAGGGSCPVAGVCGDGEVGFGEICDGDNVGGVTCEDVDFSDGVLGCTDDCASFDTSGCDADLTCSEQDIGSATGAAVAMGTTAGADNTLDATCGAAGGPDEVITFTAGATGSYTFDTFGSAYDSKLAAFLNCDPSSQLECNDDASGTTQSSISLDLAVGQVILLVIDGYDGATGAWTLNITGP